MKRLTVSSAVLPGCRDAIAVELIKLLINKESSTGRRDDSGEGFIVGKQVVSSEILVMNRVGLSL